MTAGTSLAQVRLSPDFKGMDFATAVRDLKVLARALSLSRSLSLSLSLSLYVFSKVTPIYPSLSLALSLSIE